LLDKLKNIKKKRTNELMGKSETTKVKIIKLFPKSYNRLFE